MTRTDIARTAGVPAKYLDVPWTNNDGIESFESLAALEEAFDSPTMPEVVAAEWVGGDMGLILTLEYDIGQFSETYFPDPTAKVYIHHDHAGLDPLVCRSCGFNYPAEYSLEEAEEYLNELAESVADKLRDGANLEDVPGTTDEAMQDSIIFIDVEDGEPVRVQGFVNLYDIDHTGDEVANIVSDVFPI